MVIDDPIKSSNDNKATTMKVTGRTMHNKVNIYGLKFSKNWYIVVNGNGGVKGHKGEDLYTAPVPYINLVAYRGHTLQVNYKRALLYAQTPQYL